MMEKRTQVVLHPLLFAVYPIFFLYSMNSEQVPLNDIIPAMFFSVCASILLWVTGTAFLRDYRKAAVIVTGALILFFSYGYVYSVIKYWNISGFYMGRHKYLMTLSVGIFLSIYLSVVKSRKDIKVVNDFFNVMGIILITMLLVGTGIKSYGEPDRNRQAPTSSREDENVPQVARQPLSVLKKPDIYYIILDGYTRDDVLREVYGYDNSKFINMLTSKGFFVASKSRSNYAITYLSLASSLNMRYLTNMRRAVCAFPECYYKIPFVMIQDNEVQKFLKSKGYSSIFIASGYRMTNSDRFADVSYAYKGFNEFERSLFSTSALVLCEGFFLGEDTRRRILYNFEKLEEIPRNKNTKFVFAHFAIPHPPFVFDREGKPRYHITLYGSTSYADREAYVDQVVYLNKRVEILIDKILSQSKSPPIIVLQADHGAAVTPRASDKNSLTIKTIQDMKMDIFSAYYLPDQGEKILYDSITPVNTFRLIFNHYFGTDYKRLDDVSYYSPR